MSSLLERLTTAKEDTIQNLHCSCSRCTAEIERLFVSVLREASTFTAPHLNSGPPKKSSIEYIRKWRPFIDGIIEELDEEREMQALERVEATLGAKKAGLDDLSDATLEFSDEDDDVFEDAKTGFSPESSSENPNQTAADREMAKLINSFRKEYGGKVPKRPTVEDYYALSADDSDGQNSIETAMQKKLKAKQPVIVVNGQICEMCAFDEECPELMLARAKEAEKAAKEKEAKKEKRAKEMKKAMKRSKKPKLVSLLKKPTTNPTNPKKVTTAPAKP